MEAIVRFSILTNSGFNDIDYFGVNSDLPPLSKYKVEPLVLKDQLLTGNDEKMFGARYKWSQRLLGSFTITTYPKFIVFIFYNSNKKNKLAFSKFIESLMDDLEFNGFNIQEISHYGENKINQDNDNQPNIPIIEENCENSVEDTSNSFSDDQSDCPSEEESTEANEPWEQIDENDDYKEMVRLIYEDLTPQEIAEKMNRVKETIYKRTSEMRKKYGCEIVPYFDKRMQEKCDD